jgi:hypothetical protein
MKHKIGEVVGRGIVNLLVVGSKPSANTFFWQIKKTNIQSAAGNSKTNL